MRICQFNYNNSWLALSRDLGTPECRLGRKTYDNNRPLTKTGLHVNLKTKAMLQVVGNKSLSDAASAPSEFGLEYIEIIKIRQGDHPNRECALSDDYGMVFIDVETGLAIESEHDVRRFS